MVHLCQHLSPGVKQRSQRAFLQWKAILDIPCRDLPNQASGRSFATHSRKGISDDLISQVEKSMEENSSAVGLDYQKKALRKRIPMHVSSAMDKYIRTPAVLSIHSLLEDQKNKEAWEAFDALGGLYEKHSLPHVTASLLLSSLRTDILQNIGNTKDKLSSLYLRRLEHLLTSTRESKDVWTRPELDTILDMFGKLDSVERAETIFRNMKMYCVEPPTAETYNRLMAGYLRKYKNLDNLARNRYFSKIYSLLLTMERSGPTPDTASYNLAIAARVKANNLAEAENIYARMINSGRTPDRMTYNVFLNGYLKHCRTDKDMKVADQWMDRMVDAKIVPNLRTFNNVLAGIADQVSYHARLLSYEEMQSSLKSIKSLYNIMIQLGHKPDTTTANALIKCYTAANDETEMSKMITLLGVEPSTGCGCGKSMGGCGSSAPKASLDKPDKPEPLRISPDEYTFNSLINYQLKRNKLDEAFRIYDLMLTRGFSPDTVTYGSFINYYIGKGDIPEAIKYYDVMKRKEIPSNTHIYNILLKGYFKHPAHAEPLFQRLRTMLIDNVQGDSVTYNTQLANIQLNKDGSNSSEVDVTRLTEIFDEMMAKEHTPNNSTYNIALGILGKLPESSGDRPKQTISSLLESLDTSGLQPDIIGHATMIRDAASNSNMKEAEDAFRRMLNSGVRPNIYVFAHLVWGYSKIGDLNKAQNVLHYMSEPPFNVEPTAFVFAPLIEGYAKAAEYEKAHSTFREMINRGIPADCITYTILANMFLNSSFLEKESSAISLLNDLRKSMKSDVNGKVPELDQAALTVLIEAHGVSGAKHIVPKDNYKDDNSSMKQAALQCEAHAREAQEAYDQIVKSGEKPDARAVNALITTFVRLEKLETAWDFWTQQLKGKDFDAISTYHYNALLTGFARDKSWHPVAKHLFEDMMEMSIFEDSVRSPSLNKQNKVIVPDVATFDLMILSSAMSYDDESIRRLWRLECRPKPDTTKPIVTDGDGSNGNTPLLVRSYYYALVALLNDRDLEGAREAYREFRTLTSLPDSATLWVNNINDMALANRTA
ncbi:hypothetical protein CLU79DRAFT_845615 [Phycomyces nitens]|nr:hypothetical protein CLU79DRAFT_845615 [Phycomyces nitens]